MDLPLYSQREIHEFFNPHTNEEFISIECVPNKERIMFYYPFMDTELSRNKIASFVLGKTTYYFCKIFHVDRTKKLKFDFYFGEAWFSITEKFVDYVISQKTLCEKIFSKSCCADELVFQTLYMLCDDKNERYTYKGEFNTFNELRMDILRAIDWNRGTPYTS